MRIQIGLLAGLLALGAGSAQGAQKDLRIKYKQAIVEDGCVVSNKIQRRPVHFNVQVVSDREGVKAEGTRNGKPFVTAQKGERYSVRLYNPLPVRVAVNLTVDGLNSITGKPSGIADGRKWIIEPFSSITVPGWQVSQGETRRFFFTDQRKSYAEWQGDKLGADLEENCGVIGAAFFYSQKDLDRYYQNHPIYRTTYRPYPQEAPVAGMSSKSARSADMAAGAPAAESMRDDSLAKKEHEEEIAGTGMGEREHHPTVQVAFDYDRGMYKASQALVIYYGFDTRPVPNPFPNLGYADEMP